MIRNLLVLPSGEEIFSGLVGENAIGSVRLTQCVNSEEELAPGAVCADMLEASVIVSKPLQLNAGEEVTLYTVSEDGTQKKEGIFIAEKPVWESANRYKLTAYDRVSLLDQDLTDWLAGLTGWPYYLLDFANMVCAKCGLELITEEIPNGDYQVQPFSGEGITGRQLMQWAGQIAGRFCRATAEGKLEFAWYQHTGKSVGAEEKFLQTGPAKQVELNDLTAGTPIEAISEINPSVNGKTSITLWHTGKNLLDVWSAPLYHSISASSYRHTVSIIPNGIRIEVFKGINVLDRSFWGFSLGTAKELQGKTISASADYSAAMASKYAIPYLGIFGVNVDPCEVSEDDPSYLYEGYLTAGYYTPLAYASGEGVRAITYNVTGQESFKYIAVLFAMGTLNKVSTSTGEWVQWDNIQVEFSDAPTEFQPFVDNVLVQEIPRTYGGRFDWSTGILTVTHQKNGNKSGDSGDLVAPATDTSMPDELEEPYTVSLPPRPIFAVEGYNCLRSNNGNTIAGIRQDYYFQGGLTYEDYQTAPVEKVQIRRTEDDVGAVYPDDPQKKNAYILSGNYLLTNDDPQALEAVAQNLYESMKDITYTPCKVELPASAGVCAGDIITVTDRNNKNVTLYVMSRIRSGQRDTLECTGSPHRNTTTAVNEQSYKALSGKVMEMRADVEGLRASHKDAQGRVSGVEVQVEGIRAEVSRQQTTENNLVQRLTELEQTADQVSITVQRLQEDGTQRVKTQMGYTFDDQGLKISRSNAEIKNLLDNTGMYVERGSDTVLKANNEGVQALNIAVEKFLTVGQYARLENYNNGTDSQRTACFWIGE